MTATLTLRWYPKRLSEFDGVAARFEPSALSFTESEALKAGFWDAGEDARLREDVRFTPTPWRRWVLTGRELVNDALFARMQLAPEQGVEVADAVAPLAGGRVFCPGDPRFVLRDGVIHLAGQRDLASPAGREKVLERMREARRRIFEPAPAEKAGAVKPETSSRRACLVCLEAEAGGLHLKAGPLEGLPPFVKRLTVTAGPHAWPVLASNLRGRSWRFPVHPASEPYRWVAPGHEDFLADELAPLVLEGLPAGRASVFRPDAAGVGCLTVEPVLSPGQGYRLLVPPALAGAELKPGRATPLSGGWRLWELEPPPDPDAEFRDLAERLGLKIGESGLRVHWAITPPVAYQESPQAEWYPCFKAGSVPMLRITAGVPASAGELTVFLLEEDGLQFFPLPAGSEWVVELGALPPGRYVVDVLHRSTRIAPQRLPFAVEERSTAPVSARVEVCLGPSSHAFDAEGRLTLNADLASLRPEDLEVVGPPLWPVEVFWDGGRRQRLDPMTLAPDGRLDSAELLARTAERSARSTMGDLHLDFGELGRAVLRHARAADPGELRQRLAGMLEDRAATLEGLGGQLPLVRSLWLDPLLSLLGHTVQDAPATELAGAPASATAVLLHGTFREGGRIVRRLRWPLVLAARPTPLGDEGLRALADRLCERNGVPEALLTDGLLWTRHRAGTRLRARTWDLRGLVLPGAEADFESFWFDFGV